MNGFGRFPSRWLVRPGIKCGLLVLALSFAAGHFQALADPRPTPEAEKAYQAFIAQLIAPENLADCVAKMDALIDEQERLSAGNTQPALAVGTNTKIGLHMEYTVVRTADASMYYFIFSRNGQDLRYDDATRMIALFCDRVGLPHPITIREGEKPVFNAQWLIKPSEWKAMSKMIQKTRGQNRAEKDPQRALSNAILRELNARQGGR